MSSLNFYAVTIVPLIDGLLNAQAFIKKAYEEAQAKGTDPNDLLNASLHPDMKGFIYQVQRFTDTAKFTPPRLNPAIEAISLPDEEKTFPELFARIEKTIAYLKSIDKKSLEGRETEQVSIPFKSRNIEAKYTGLSYIGQFAHPNFW